MNTNFVIVADRFSPNGLNKLKLAAGLETIQTNEPSKDELARVAALVTRTRTKVDAAFLDQTPNLKMIVTATSGFDHIDVAEALKRNVRVFFAPEGNVHSATEMTWALVLACARKMMLANRMIEKGQWERDAVRGQELFGKTYGIVGLGRIGTRVTRIAQAFGMNVIAFDPYVPASHFDGLRVERLGMKELLRAADFVSLHVPLTSETRHFINSKTIDLMPDHAWLINTSRGPVVGEQELIKALDEGTIAGCGLDVFEQEPLSAKSPLRKRANVILLPHCGGNTFEAFERSSLVAAQRVIDFFEDPEMVAGDTAKEAWFVAQQLNQGFRMSLE